jgi:hypothetical protein
MLNSNGSLLAKAARRALMAAVALGSLLVLMDAGAEYSGLGWRTAPVAREPSDLERAVSAPGFTPLEFRLSGNFPLERGQRTCADALTTGLASQGGDEPLDINDCAVGPSVKAVGDLPRTELLSWPGDWLYHRALRF